MTGAMPAIISQPDQLVETLLKNRGIKNKQDRAQFFHPKMEDFTKEFTLEGIDQAKKRILQAIKSRELVIIFGDYDVDGLTATALAYHGLTALGGQVLPYIPHREKEGYGLSKLGIDYARSKQAGLILTVDNGIVANQAVAYAKEQGIEVIITDHHVPSDIRPESLAIVHSTNLSGAGVAWSLIQAMVPEDLAKKLLSFAAMGAICDLMPVLGVNRAIIKDGLEILRKTDRIGLLALASECGLNINELSTYHISHILGPRLNAVGRLESAMDALRLLCTKDPAKANQLARKLSEVNESKKQLTVDAIWQAGRVIQEDGFNLSNKKIIILHSKEWIPGIIGLVAGRISEEYRLPSIIISEGEKFSKGSARSSNGFDIIQAIRSCADCLIDVGGHPQAAGFTIETSKIPVFKKRMEEVLEQLEVSEGKGQQAEVLVNLRKVNQSWVEELEKMEPFGVGNPKPVLGAEGVRISNLRTVGAGKHLKFLADGVEAIAFGMGEMTTLLAEGNLVKINFYLDLDTYNGGEKLQLKVLDIQSN